MTVKSTEGVTLSGVCKDEDCKLIALWRNLIKFKCRRGKGASRINLSGKRTKSLNHLLYKGIFYILLFLSDYAKA